MKEIFKKVEKVVTNKVSPINAEEARLLVYTGKLDPLEKRLSRFIEQCNLHLVNRAKLGKQYTTIEIPKDLIISKSNIVKVYKDRGFKIHEIPDLNNIILLYW